MRRILLTSALVVAALATGLGIAAGATTLLAPTGVRCELPALQPGVGQTGVSNCVPVSLIDQGLQIWPLPLVAIIVWSLAPLLAVIGSLRLLRGRSGLAFVALALVAEGSAIISFVAGPLFLLWVLAPLVLAMLLAALGSVAHFAEGTFRTAD